MMKFFKSALTILSYVNICFLVVLTVVTVIDVIARYVFNTSFLDAITLSSNLLAVINALALPGITLRRGHVQVDLVYDRLPAGVRRGLDSINSLLAGILFFLLAWFAFARATHSFHRGFYRGWMKVPEYPAKYLFAFGCLLTAVTFFILFFNALMDRKDASRLSDQLQ
jgi:TRAP-type C4-dicarboxylate transport system permease small subunit